MKGDFDDDDVIVEQSMLGTRRASVRLWSDWEETTLNSERPSLSFPASLKTSPLCSKTWSVSC